MTKSALTLEDRKARIKANAKQWRLRNKEKVQENGRASRAKRKERHAKQIAEWLQRHPGQELPGTTIRQLERLGLTLEDYEKLIRSQDGKCGICRRLPESGKRRFCIDHNHETLEVRGLLCHRCNVGLGHFRERFDLFTKASDYLQKKPTKHRLPKPINPRKGRVK